MKTCPNCGGVNFSKNPNKYALSSWEKDANGSIALTIDKFMPVKVENCTSCGYLNIYFDTSMQSQVR